MIYRIRIDLAYPEDVNPRSIQAHAQTLFNQAITINPGADNEERGYIQFEHCYHDEDPQKPCTIIDQQYTPV